MTSPSTPADKEGTTLRERWAAFIGNNGEDIAEFMRSELSRAAPAPQLDAALVDRVAKQLERLMRLSSGDVGIGVQARMMAELALTELSRAGAERVDAPSDGDIERAKGVLGAASGHMSYEEAGALLVLVDALEESRRQLAAIEAARAKAMEGAAEGFVHDEEWLRELSCEVAGQDVDGTVDAVGYALDELDRRATVIAAQAAELEQLRAARAKAMEGASIDFKAMALRTEAIKKLPAETMVIKVHALDWNEIWGELDRLATVIAAQAQELASLRAELETARTISREMIAAADASSRRLLDRIHDHLAGECHDGIRDLDTHRELLEATAKEGGAR